MSVLKITPIPFGCVLAIAALTNLSAEPYPNMQSAEQAAYTSPYIYSSDISAPGVQVGFDVSPRAFTNWQNWSLTPYSDWTNFAKIQELDSTWGPYFKPFNGPETVLTSTTQWLQARLVASASLLRNTVPYGHHHMQVWDVPNTPEWTNAGYEPGYGIDCSDFTHWTYNYGLGIQLKTGVGEQAVMTSAEIKLSDGTTAMVESQHIFDVQNGFDKNYATLVAGLQPGDLLYIRSDPALTNPISHVIMWLGGLASDTNGIDSYLVTDSHGDVVYDSNGNLIPSGPEIRPFREDSYYFGSFDHAVRYAPIVIVPEPTTTVLLALGALSLLAKLKRAKGGGRGVTSAVSHFGI